MTRSSTPPRLAPALLAAPLSLVLGACGGGVAEAKVPEGQGAKNGERQGAAIVLTDRIVEVQGGIGEQNMKSAQEKMLEYDEQSHDPIWILINSGGGSVEAGLILIDTMRGIESPMHCLVESKAYSMAAIILSFCDRRLALPHATIMLHEASYGTAGEDPSNRARLDFLARYLDRLHVEIAERLGMPVDKYRARIRDAWWLLADDAKKVGVVHDIASRIEFRRIPVAQTEIKTTQSLQVSTHEVPAGAGTKIPKRRD